LIIGWLPIVPQSHSERKDTIPEINNLDTAKALVQQIFYYLDQADSKIISKRELDKKAMPLQKRMDSLRNYFSSSEILELDNYRTKLASALVDKKVARDRKK
jgi:hypothetical protein